MAYTNINKGANYHNSITWTADDTSPRTFTGFTCQPDLLLGRHRNSGSLNYNLVDSSRGGSANITPDTTAGEDNGSHGIISSFNSNGITVTNGNNATYPRLYYNEYDPFGANAGEYVYHYWNVNNGTTSSNTDGNITSTVQVNTTAGVSIITYTGTGSSGNTVGHGLGSAPKMTIIKQRNTGNGWNVWHYGNNSGDPDSFGELNGNAAWYQNQGVDGPFTTVPSSSVLTLTGYGQVNASGGTYLGLCFSEIKGYSKFGTYIGNGSTDGAFVYTGFKPAWLMIKNVGASGSWQVRDVARSPYNLSTNRLWLDNPSAESTTTTDTLDILSNGFKMRNNVAGNNGSGNTYVFAAFAQSPFTTSTGIPTTAR